MQYVGIDIGGSKTLAASLDENGVILQKVKFPTNHDYDAFLEDLTTALQQLGTDDYQAGAVAVPGRIDRKLGIGQAFGNLPWQDVPIQHDIEQLVHCPVILEHDPSLAALSETMLLHETQPDIAKVLYVTISTGIGAGMTVDGVIDKNFSGSEAGKMVIEHDHMHEQWEKFASGSAIVRRYGKLAMDITDDTTWQAIAHDISLGMQELIAITEPEIIIIGGSVGRYFDRFGAFLQTELVKYDNPLVPIPPIQAAGRPDDAVVYGCYDIAKQTYGQDTASA